MSVMSIRSFINGDFAEPLSDAWLDNFEPATGTVYSRVANSGPADIDLAYAAARRASESWGQESIASRSHWLNKIADGIQSRLPEFAQAETRDSGKPMRLSLDIEIPRAIENFRFFASLISGTSSHAHDGPLGLNVTLKQPWGVVGTISPWNLPLYLFSWKIAPALAAGNCVIAKPSELTPKTAQMLGEVCRDIGLPPGVLNIIQGTGGSAGQALVEHPGIKAISFTGGTVTGSRIAATAAPKFKKLSLELGGKNPNLIFADCDYEKMLQTTLRSSFQNQGQICLCGSRIYVQQEIYSKFLDDFTQRTQALKLGDPEQGDTQVGAVISEAHQNKILRAIKQAVDDGGQVISGGEKVPVPGRCANGWFVAPTIIVNNTNACAVNQEEIFGPVVTVQPFEDAAHALKLANDSRYGLSATIWTRHLDQALDVGRQIDAGVVWINGWLVRDLRTPFGGMKDSGVGREGGWDALDFWTQSKNVCFCR